MKKMLLILILSLTCSITFGQNKEEAEKLVDEGVAFHDKGEYAAAISKYDKALELDKDNLLALVEKAFSLLSLQKNDESISYCKKAIATHPGEKGLKTVYVTYGNALDGLNKTDQAIEIYDEGIRQFPSYYQLPFNKGIALAGTKRYEEAILCFQNSVKINPLHGSSHNAIARLTYMNDKRIPALLAYCRFLAIEPGTSRAKENLESVQKIIKANVEKTGENSINLNISPDMLSESTGKGKPKENSFASTDLILAMTAALDYDKKNIKKTAIEQFIRKFETVCASLQETQKDNYGFYWDYYVPYFTEMKGKKHIETFAYIAFSSSDDPDVSEWLTSHKNEIGKFLEWSKSFTWKTD
jgi:tetratricopeptide (TPR) repeat protein